MATSKQTQAAKRNVQKAQRSAAAKKTIAHLPSKTRTALDKQGAAVAGASAPAAPCPRLARSCTRSPGNATWQDGPKWTG
jgi:hypothetical protein